MRKRMNLRLFDLDASLIDRSGAESLIPEQYAREIHPGRCIRISSTENGQKTAEHEFQQVPHAGTGHAPDGIFCEWGQRTETDHKDVMG